MGVSKTVIENTHWLFSKDNPLICLSSNPQIDLSFVGVSRKSCRESYVVVRKEGSKIV